MENATPGTDIQIHDVDKTAGGGLQHIVSNYSKQKHKYSGERPQTCSGGQTSSDKSIQQTGIRERLYKCNNCSATFTRLASLKTHQQKHAGKAKQ